MTLPRAALPQPGWLRWPLRTWQLWLAEPRVLLTLNRDFLPLADLVTFNLYVESFPFCMLSPPASPVTTPTQDIWGSTPGSKHVSFIYCSWALSEAPVPFLSQIKKPRLRKIRARVPSHAAVSPHPAATGTQGILNQPSINRTRSPLPVPVFGFISLERLPGWQI